MTGNTNTFRVITVSFINVSTKHSEEKNFESQHKIIIMLHFACTTVKHSYSKHIYNEFTPTVK